MTIWNRMKNHYKSPSAPIEGFLHNNTAVSAPTEMCNLARLFYEDQFARHIDSNDDIEHEANVIDQDLSFELANCSPTALEITFLSVQKAISSLKPKNSTGLDGVSNKMIKCLPTSHLTFITASFTFMAKMRRTPKHWQTAKIVLLSKTKSSLVDLNDTRPISLLSSFSKLYEKLFLVRLRKWIDDHGILPDEQTGFRPGHNMSTRIVSLIDQIGQGLALNTATAAVFFDFKSAFNQLWINGLWLKLKRLNCPLVIIAWLRNYLSDRSAFLEIKGEKSLEFHQHKGVPQGSCIGPVLFILFHHDILNSVANIHFKHLYADDLAVVLSPSPFWPFEILIHRLAEQIENAVHDLHKYSVMWKQPLNLKKTSWNLFHRQVSPRIPPIKCCNVEIEHVTKFKYLGAILDSKLSFNCHIDSVKAKVNRNISIFKRLAKSRMLSNEISLRLFHAYIRPHYQSLLFIFPILSFSKQQQLEALNRRTHRIISGWHDATNDEISNVPSYKSLQHLTKLNFNNLLKSIERSNPGILADYLQHKMHLLYLREYYLNPSLRKQKKSMVPIGRTPDKILQLLDTNNRSLLDWVFGFE